MPIYEFYCRRCNTVYNFFARSASTDRIPSCPRCKTVKLKRQMSLFSKVSGRKDEAGAPDDGLPPIDEARMEKAMAMLAAKADKMNEDNPRQAAGLMREISEATGVKLGAGMEEALRRMENGEDPDRIEQEMGDLLEGEEPFLFEQKGGKASKKGKPRVDETLYDL
ncbi:MAG: zinc ribbon domain-containing protein [Smithellaceae bacterium]|nr:zinc ribbon domain-containing protein [Smithellaceae bacterium]